MTSQSSVEAIHAAGQPAPTLRLAGVAVWRWHRASRSRASLLDEIDWEVHAGERWAVLGPNGAGKTTLLEIAAAAAFPSRGAVEILGETMGRTDVHRLRTWIGLVDARAGARLAPGLSVRQVVRTGATQTIGYFEERLAPASLGRVEQLLREFGLERLAERRFADCSHGERMRALVARALVARPRLLLLDEPGAGLDLPGRELLLAALARLAHEEPRLATVHTTHHLEELPASTTHALLLRGGRPVAHGRVEDVLAEGPLSECFGLELALSRRDGRWSAVARGPQAGPGPGALP